MADVPGSGVLSLLGIYNEVAEGDYSSVTSRTNVSLTGISDGSVDDLVGGNKSSPHAMSEFYGYSHTGPVFNAPSNFSMPADVDGEVQYSSVQTIAVTTGPFSGDTDVTCGTGTFGLLKVALAASSGGPFSGYTATDSLGQSGTTSIYAKFQVTIADPVGSGGSSARTITLANDSGASTTFTITVVAAGE